MSGSRSALFFPLLAIAVALAAPAHAEKFYKWVDEKGVTHYGEKAPENAQSSTVKIGDTTSSDAEDEIKRLNERRSTTTRKAEEGAAASTPAASAEKNKTACEQHRKNLDSLKSGKRIRSLGADGQPRDLSAEQIAAQIKFAEDELNRCSQLEQMQNSTNKAPLAPKR